MPRIALLILCWLCLFAYNSTPALGDFHAQETPPPQVGIIEMPFICCGDGGDAVVQRGATLPVTWKDFPPDAARYVISSSPDLTIIGEDVDSSDGVQVQWTVPDDFSGLLYGEAYDEDGTLIAVAPAFAQWISAGEPPDEPYLQRSELSLPVTRSGDFYFIHPNERILIWWHDAPQSETENFKYSLIQVARGGTEQVIDECCENSTDVIFEWRVPERFVGSLRAEAVDRRGVIRAEGYSQYRLITMPRIGYLEMPYLFADAGMVAVEGGATIPVTWVDFPPEAETYSIFSTDDQVVIGEDTDNSDGVEIQWTVPMNYSGSLHGEAYDKYGVLIGIAHSPPDVGATTVPPLPSLAELFEGTPPAEECIATYNAPYEAPSPIFARPFYEDPIGELPPLLGTVVIGQAAGANDSVWYQITLENARLNEGVTAEYAWIGAGAMAIYEPCSAIPQVDFTQPDAAGELSLAVTRSGDEYLIHADERVIIWWHDAPKSETEHFRYYFFQVAQDGTEQLIDRCCPRTITDVLIEWRVPEGFVGAVRVEVRDRAGTLRYGAYAPHPLRAVPLIGYLDMPYLFGDAGMVVIEAGATLPVTWVDFPPEAVRYTIVGTYDQVVIGEDVDNSDGVQIQWEVPLSYSGALHGEAYDEDGALIGIAHSPPDVGATTVPPLPSAAELFEGTPPDCAATNQAYFFGDAEIYGSLDFDDVIGVLPLHVGAVAVGQAARPPDGLLFYQITLENARLNEGVTAETGWVLERYLHVYEPCSGIPEVTP